MKYLIQHKDVARLSATQIQVAYRAHTSTTNGVCNGVFHVHGFWK